MRLERCLASNDIRASYHGGNWPFLHLHEQVAPRSCSIQRRFGHAMQASPVLGLAYFVLPPPKTPPDSGFYSRYDMSG